MWKVPNIHALSWYFHRLHSQITINQRTHVPYKVPHRGPLLSVDLTQLYNQLLVSTYGMFPDLHALYSPALTPSCQVGQYLSYLV